MIQSLNCDWSAMIGHDQISYRSRTQPVKNVIDGEFVSQFLSIPISERDLVMNKWREEWEKRLNALDDGSFAMEQSSLLPLASLKTMIQMDSESMVYLLHVLNHL